MQKIGRSTLNYGCQTISHIIGTQGIAADQSRVGTWYYYFNGEFQFEIDADAEFNPWSIANQFDFYGDEYEIDFEDNQEPTGWYTYSGPSEIGLSSNGASK